MIGALLGWSGKARCTRINDRGTKAPLTSIPTSSLTTIMSTQERNPPFTDKKEAS
jgi:hypothetical protein